jgi:hypothetical protein
MSPLARLSAEAGVRIGGPCHRVSLSDPHLPLPLEFTTGRARISILFCADIRSAPSNCVVMRCKLMYNFRRIRSILWNYWLERKSAMRKFAALALYATFPVCMKAQLPVNLGSAASFAALAGSTITSTGATVLNGNLGISPGSALTGFPPGIVTGGSIYLADPVAAQAQSDLTAAYNDAAGRVCPGPPLPGDIGGTTILPGVYCSASSVGITGIVTLNGNGNPNAVFIFQIGSTLTTAAGNSVVNLIGGAAASNVFWQVGTSATLGTYTRFSGTILAQASITVTSGAALNGRALARTGATTLADSAITTPAASGAGPSVTCAYPSGQVDVAYSSSLVATGGTPPYNYSISAGSLPPGLMLNPSTGAITGVPTTAGSFAYTAKVVDAASASATSSCGPLIVKPEQMSGVPAPPSLILVLTALALTSIYLNRERLLRRWRGN